MKRYEILCDEKHLFISVIGSYVRRELTIPIGALLTDRHGGRPKLLGLFSDGRISVEGHRPFQPLSFEANFVLDEFLTQGSAWDVRRRLGLPEESHGRCLVSDWAKEFRMHGVAPWSVWTSATFGNYVKRDNAVMYSEEFIEAIRPSAEAALAEMKVCGYRVVSGKLSPLGVSHTSKTDCVTRMRDAGIAARKAA